MKVVEIQLRKLKMMVVMRNSCKEVYENRGEYRRLQPQRVLGYDQGIVWLSRNTSCWSALVVENIFAGARVASKPLQN